MRYILIIAALLCISGGNILAQEKCATAELEMNHREPVSQFEKWLYKKKELQQGFSIFEHSPQRNALYTIPVVIHVVHQGEPVGTGSNISYEQILSQLEVLNEDFRRLNPDAVNTPDPFLPFAADPGIEFVLALQDPQGNPTTGIVRVQGEQNNWNPNIHKRKLAQQSYWDPEDYMNIWVTDLTDPYLGYAQFPVSDLPGLEGIADNANYDGVVIDYKVFGSKAKYPQANLEDPYNLGRTLTHEVGHFFGLRHIWGDGGCSYDDFVNDTPVSSQPNYTGDCTYPGPNSCNSGANDFPDMIQNFMDYTDDKCMNLFTLNQKERMVIVLENSPRRASLLNSPALFPSENSYVDVELKRVVSPTPALCSDELIPTLQITNTGSLPIGSLTIAMNLNDISRTASFSLADSLKPGQTIDLNFMGVNLSEGNKNIAFELLRANGEDGDLITSNNFISKSFVIDDTQVPLPLRENFNGDMTWLIVNPDDQLTWEISDDKSIFPSSRYSGQQEKDWIVSPLLDFSEVNDASLQFDLTYSGPGDESLEVFFSIDCGKTYSSLNYYKQGMDLNTSGAIRRESVYLDPVIGHSDVRIAIAAKSGSASDIVLDNLEIFLSKDPVIITTGDNVALYPNPSQGPVKLTFSLSELTFVEVTIIDNMGQVRAQKEFSNTLNQTHTIEMYGLPEGMYFISVMGKNIKFIKKLIYN